MNWLTDQLGGLRGGFASLADFSQAVDGSTLSRVPIASLMERLPATVDGPIDDLSAVRGFALIEQGDDAKRRFEMADESGGPFPWSFTLAIVDDATMSVLYLPDVAEERTSLQLFTFDVDGRLARIRADGQFGDDYAHVDELATISTAPCTEGPCTEWGAACGPGCTCTKYEPSAAGGEYLASIGSRIRGHVYGLVCE